MHKTAPKRTENRTFWPSTAPDQYGAVLQANIGTPDVRDTRVPPQRPPTFRGVALNQPKPTPRPLDSCVLGRGRRVWSARGTGQSGSDGSHFWNLLKIFVEIFQKFQKNQKNSKFQTRGPTNGKPKYPPSPQHTHNHRESPAPAPAPALRCRAGGSTAGTLSPFQRPPAPSTAPGRPSAGSAPPLPLPRPMLGPCAEDADGASEPPSSSAPPSQGSDSLCHSDASSAPQGQAQPLSAPSRASPRMERSRSLFASQSPSRRAAPGKSYVFRARRPEDGRPAGSASALAADERRQHRSRSLLVGHTYSPARLPRGGTSHELHMGPTHDAGGAPVGRTSAWGDGPDATRLHSGTSSRGVP